MYLIRIYEDGIVATAEGKTGKITDALKQVGFVECDKATFEAAAHYFETVDGADNPPTFEDWLKSQQ